MVITPVQGLFYLLRCEELCYLLAERWRALGWVLYVIESLLKASKVVNSFWILISCDSEPGLIPMSRDYYDGSDRRLWDSLHEIYPCRSVNVLLDGVEWRPMTNEQCRSYALSE